jgi:CBS domain containing-hemolysin-like protein
LDLATPFPAAVLLLVAGGLGFSSVILLSGAALALLFGVLRHALDDFPRQKLLNDLPSDVERQRFEKMFETLERTRLATVLLRLAAEVAFIVALTDWWRQIHVFDLPDQSLLHLFVCAMLALLYLVPFCRILPRMFSQRRLAEVVTRRALPVMHRVAWLLSPGLDPLLSLQKLWPGPVTDTHQEITEDIMTAVEEGEREGVIKEDEASMIGSIIELRKRDVSEIMTNRSDIMSVDVRTPLAQTLDVASESGHSRIPVFEGERDHIIGVLYIKDALPFFNRPSESMPSLREVMRNPHFVPETKGIRQLLAEFRATKLQMAIVVDEFGSTAGLVTLEDVLEQIVGDIADEDGLETSPIRRVDQNTADVSASVSIDEVNELLGIHLEKSDDFGTVGGYVSAALGKIPKTGDILVRDNIELKVLGADDRRIHRVLVRALERKE